MKANEAPEKIYIFETDLQREDHRVMYGTNQDSNIRGLVEYTQTDAFIEKACSCIDKLLSGYIIRNFHFVDSYEIDKLIKDFKNYMKGE